MNDGPLRWVLLYDADCGFCKWVAAGLLRRDRAGSLRPVALQRPEAADLLADLSESERLASWHIVSPDGARSSGGAGLPVVLRLLPGGSLAAGLLMRAPRITDLAYRWVAEHRMQLSRWVPSKAKRRASEYVAELELRER